MEQSSKSPPDTVLDGVLQKIQELRLEHPETTQESALWDDVVNGVTLREKSSAIPKATSKPRPK